MSRISRIRWTPRKPRARKHESNKRFQPTGSPERASPKRASPGASPHPMRRAQGNRTQQPVLSTLGGVRERAFPAHREPRTRQPRTCQPRPVSAPGAQGAGKSHPTARTLHPRRREGAGVSSLSQLQGQTPQTRSRYGSCMCGQARGQPVAAQPAHVKSAPSHRTKIPFPRETCGASFVTG